MHFFTLAEFSLICLFYAFFFKRYFNPIFFYVFIPLLLIIALYDYKINGLSNFDNYSVSVESIFLIGFSMFFFYYCLKHLLFEDNILNSPAFWMNTAVLVYFSGNLFLFVFSNYLMKADPKMRFILWGVIHSSFNMLYNLVLATGFWKAKVK